MRSWKGMPMSGPEVTLDLDMPLSVLMARWPATIPVFTRYQMLCLGWRCQTNGLVAFTFRSLSSFRQPFVRRRRGFCHLTTSASVANCRTINVLEYRPFGLASGFPTVAPDQLCLEGFEERFNHGIVVTIVFQLIDTLKPSLFRRF